MRIAIVTLVTPVQKRGIGNYVVNLINGLQQVDTDNEYYIFVGSDTRDLFDLHAANFYPVVVPLRHDPRWLLRPVYFVWQNSFIALPLARRRIDVLHLPNLLPLAVPFVPTVVTVPDLTEFKVDKYGTFRQFYRKFLPHLIVRTSSRIITISENSKRELVEETGVFPDKVDVTYLAPGVVHSGSVDHKDNGRVLLRERFGIEDDYILYVGSWLPHKNIPRLLSAFAKLKKGAGIRQSLVLVGKADSTLRSLLEKAHELSIEDHVIVTGYVPDDELPILYAGADLFVFPSISEGFGMPILEAMTYETPVITSNVSSLSEIAKDAAVTIDPFSVHELADAMLTVLNNDDLRNSLIARGKERAKQFSWTTCAKQTVDVYKQAVGSNIDSEACVKR